MTSSLSQLLGKCPKEDLPNFFHGLADNINNRPSISYKLFSAAWTLDEWFEVTDQCSTLMKTTVSQSIEKESLFKSLDGIDDDLKDIFWSVLSTRKCELEDALKEKTVGVSDSYLQDFDWKVKLAISSDKIASIQEPLATLDLDIKSGNGNKMVSVELNKEELKSMITTLEAANRAVMQLTA